MDAIHGPAIFLAQFVGELAELAALQAAHVSRRLDQIKERGLGGLGHEGRLRRRMGGDNLSPCQFGVAGKLFDLVAAWPLVASVVAV